MTTSKTKRTSVFIHPYNGSSAGAKTLTERLKGKRILTGGRSKFVFSKGKTVINWGSSEYHISKDTPMLNNPAAVAKASNKLTFFETLKNSSTRLVPFTTSEEQVQAWLDEGAVVCARQKLTGHSGEGIVMLYPDADEITLDKASAKLYTRYVKKAREYRVHVFRGKIIRVQMKILQPELTARLQDESDPFSKEDINWEVRNHGNGFIYITDDGNVGKKCPVDVTRQAVLAVKACGLDFGAVDLIWNARKEKSFVLEINTSPGLEGGTVDAYVKAFQDFIDSSESVESAPFALKLSGRFTKKSLGRIDISYGSISEEDGLDKIQACLNGDAHAGNHWCGWKTTQHLTGVNTDAFDQMHDGYGITPALRDLMQDLLIIHGRTPA